MLQNVSYHFHATNTNTKGIISENANDINPPAAPDDGAVYFYFTCVAHFVNTSIAAIIGGKVEFLSRVNVILIVELILAINLIHLPLTSPFHFLNSLNLH